NYMFRFPFDYSLMLLVAIILSCVYFIDRWQVIVYLLVSYAFVVVTSLITPEPQIPPDLLLTRMLLALAGGYGIFEINLRLAQKISQSNAQFKIVSENSTDLVALHDDEGKIIYISPSVKDMLGFEVEEALGDVATQFIHPEDRKGALEIYVNQLFGKRNRVRMEYRLVRKNGSTIWVEVVGIPLQDATDSGATIITTSRDISKRKKAEAETAQYHESLRQINEELDQFAYVVSHDLKAPLRGIANLSQFIMEDLAEEDIALPEDVQTNIGLLQDRVRRMEAMINDILAYSRAGRIQDQEGIIDVKKVLTEIVDSIALPADFEVVLPENLPEIAGSRVAFAQVFTNLISNAWSHHDKATGKITIGYAREDGFHQFSVQDDGPGIAAEHHERVFNVFEHLKQKDKGTGIGLAIVKKIVEAVGGKISLDSDVGQGATFTFTWPSTRA
ncbi:MAG: ATP-binding protein, partial [Bacteroidota bacterium]